MKPPRKVKIGHSTWTLRSIDRHQAKLSDDDGSLVPSERWLTYADDLCPERTREVIVHEATHAIIDAAGGQKALGLEDDDDEERLVSLLTGPIMSMIVDNPGLIRYLTAKDAE